MSHFADRIILRTRKLGHPLCVGLDPHLDAIPPLFRRGEMRPGATATAEAVRDFCLACLSRVATRAVCVKPQSAFFEQLGASGIAVLADVISAARDLDCPVILDAKRGDIGSTSDAYARAYLDLDAPLAVDALTLNPFLGLDTLEPFAERAASAGRGLFILVKTSNPGSGDFQDRVIDGDSLSQLVARTLAPLAETLRGPETGWSSLGVVVGATYPEQSRAIREILPHALFLVPGFGAQGGHAADAVLGFAPGPAGLEGGLVNSSRGILFPPDACDAEDSASWEHSIDAALDSACRELGAAVSR